MMPVVLGTSRLRLDSPVASDRALLLEYCQDPLFEKFLTLPWPYKEHHAEVFLENLVPRGWDSATEYTWALRLPTPGDTDTGTGTGTFLGVVSYRAGLGDIGFWIGSPHRGRGYMTEAVNAVAAWVFGRGVRSINWECVAGNVASASVARKAGFRYTGERPSGLPYRDGSHPASWHATLRPVDVATVHPGWPAELGAARDGIDKG